MESLNEFKPDLTSPVSSLDCSLLVRWEANCVQNVVINGIKPSII